MKRLLIAVLALSGCKGGSTASSETDLETCSVPQSEIETDNEDVNPFHFRCEPTVTGIASTLDFKFYADGGACSFGYSSEGDELFGGCESKTWTRSECMLITVENSSAESTFEIDAINAAPSGFNTNIRYVSSTEDFIYAYTCERVDP